MSEKRDNWTTQLTGGGAIVGGVIGYIVLDRLFEQPDATAAEAGGRAMVSAMLGALGGTPIGAGAGFVVGKVLDKLNIKH